MMKPAEISAELVKDRVSRLLRTYAGRGGPHSVPELAALTHQDERTVRSHHGGENGLELFRFLRYGFVLPPAFTNATIELIGLTGAHEVDAPKPTDHQLNAGLADALAVVADALKDDGRICHLEEPGVHDALREVMVLAARRLNGNDGAAV